MYPRSWFSVLLFFSPGLEARMLSQIVKRNSRADFPSGQQEVPGKKLGRKQNDLEISPKIGSPASI
jgi:hypothetical protein